jgi:hypothetical protein
VPVLRQKARSLPSSAPKGSGGDLGPSSADAAQRDGAAVRQSSAAKVRLRVDMLGFMLRSSLC